MNVAWGARTAPLNLAVREIDIVPRRPGAYPGVQKSPALEPRYPGRQLLEQVGSRLADPLGWFILRTLPAEAPYASPAVRAIRPLRRCSRRHHRRASGEEPRRARRRRQRAEAPDAAPHRARRFLRHGAPGRDDRDGLGAGAEASGEDPLGGDETGPYRGAGLEWEGGLEARALRRPLRAGAGLAGRR